MSYVYLGSRVGIQATLEKADICGEFILASSETPPDFESGPTASTLHRINSLQKPYNTQLQCQIHDDIKRIEQLITEEITKTNKGKLLFTLKNGGTIALFCWLIHSFRILDIFLITCNVVFTYKKILLTI